MILADATPLGALVRLHLAAGHSQTLRVLDVHGTTVHVGWYTPDSRWVTAWFQRTQLCPARIAGMTRTRRRR